MPIYEFKCRQCLHSFEELVKVGGHPDACPSCGSQDIAKQFSAFALGKEAKASALGSCAPASSCAMGGCPSAAGCGFN